VKWKSHRAITSEVCAALGLEDRYCELMLAGAVEPDRHHEVRRDHRGLLRRVRHHGSPDQVILIFIWKARKAYLEGDYEEASRDMGRALHYIQDRSVAKGWRGRAHDRREAAVAARPVPVRAISIGMEGAVSSPWFVRDCVQATKERSEPDRIMFQASMMSAAVAKAIVSDPDPPLGLEGAVRRAHRAYLLISWPLAIGLTVGLVLLGVSTGFQLHYVAPLALLVPIPLRARYRRLVRLSQWYGLDD
jgi:hypothetical protein